MIVIVDVGLGNVASVKNMLDHLGLHSKFCASPDQLAEHDRYVLPGVGAFDEGVRRLRKSGWYEHLKALPETAHVLGICLGMQLLGMTSEEGTEDGLGRVPAHFKKFDPSNVRVPHMGWNQVKPVALDPLFELDFPELRFYFTHSYRAVCENEAVEIGSSNHGGNFTSAYRSGNTRGVQFHPEKSHKYGMALLAQWASL